MLKSLYIKNYALIDSLEIDFTDGFSVITGETGAGKSIILGALGLIVGQRADTKSIKQGEDKCIIEATFDVSNYNLKSFCEEHDIDYDAESYIIRREILGSGKSRAFINDSPATLNNLKDLGGRLIDIHSQHQNLLLGDDVFQMQVVDILSSSQSSLEKYQEAFKEYKNSEKKLSDLKKLLAKGKKDEEYLRFQFTTLNEAKLLDGEQEELEEEEKTLTHAEDIKTALYKCFTILSDENIGATNSLHESLSTLRTIEGVFEKSQELSQRIETAYIDLQDLSSELERMTEDIEYSPERLAEVQVRLDTIYTLQKRYKKDSISELIDLREQLKEQLENIDSSDTQLADLEAKVERTKAKMLDLGNKLSENRKKAVPSIEKTLMNKTSVLGMPNIKFECSFSAKEEPDMDGLDQLTFMFSANKNVPLQPVSEIASGGEISRLMLCLKSMIAGATALPTIIFDEIDTGVSGEIADKMGNIMQEFGLKMQVLAITHLPQIAAKGKAHYKVFKKDNESTTTTNLIRLTDKQRLEEIAGMLSGANVTDAALSNAKEMLGF